MLYITAAEPDEDVDEDGDRRRLHQQDDKLQQPTTVTLLMSVDEPQLIQS